MDESDSWLLLSGLLFKLATDFELQREEEGREGGVSMQKEYGENNKTSKRKQMHDRRDLKGTTLS